LFYQSTKRVIKLIGHLSCDVTAINLMQNVIQYHCLKVISIYIYDVTGDHQCGFRHNRSTIDKIFYIRQILGKKCECNETVHQLFIEFGVPIKLLRLIKMCLNEMYSKVRVG
jgi:hypothetical protein